MAERSRLSAPQTVNSVEASVINAVSAGAQSVQCSIHSSRGHDVVVFFFGRLRATVDSLPTSQ
jgi:Iap family predicted aminopeptidase